MSRAFAKELKTKTVNQIIEEVDKFYKENPGKLSTSVLEVILIRCTTACPPGWCGSKEVMSKLVILVMVVAIAGGRLFRDVQH